MSITFHIEKTSIYDRDILLQLYGVCNYKILGVGISQYKEYYGIAHMATFGKKNQKTFIVTIDITTKACYLVFRCNNRRYI